jgi:hypothetical protein
MERIRRDGFDSVRIDSSDSVTTQWTGGTLPNVWKAASFVLLSSSLALAQSATEPPSPKSANPLAGATFWPKAQSFTNPSAGIVPRIRISKVPDTWRPVDKTYTLGESMNRTPGKPGSGRCAIPLVRLRIPTDQDFALQQFVPEPMDGNFVGKPAVPSCEG